LLVVIIVAPTPVFPVSPIATQFSLEEQLMPVTSTASEGPAWSDHVPPLFAVPITNVEESKSVPTATQVVSIGQATAFRRVPPGIDVVVLQSLKLLVARDVTPSPAFKPTATQVVSAEHEIPVRRTTEDSVSSIHELPSCDSRIAGSPLITPIAAQLMALGQEIAVIDVVPIGAVC
jgi:hypothetical protein